MPMGVCVAPDGHWVYVSTGRGKSIAILDAATGRIDGTIADVGARPWGIGVTPDGKKLYTANGPSGDVTVIDAHARSIVKRIPAGRSPWGIAVVK